MRTGIFSGRFTFNSLPVDSAVDALLSSRIPNVSSPLSPTWAYRSSYRWVLSSFSGSHRGAPSGEIESPNSETRACDSWTGGNVLAILETGKLDVGAVPL